MLKAYDFERLVDYVRYLPEAKKAELEAKSSREREQARETREWYEAEIAALRAKMGQGQKKILSHASKFQGQQVVGLYADKTCGVCGQWFLPNAPNQKCCSDACRLELRRVTWNKRLMAIANGENCVVALGQEIACLWCSKLFIKKSTSNKYCCAACATAADRRRSKICYVGKVRMKTCEMCGTVFPYTTHARKYCGWECVKRAKGKNTHIKSIVEMANNGQQNVVVNSK